MRAAWVLACLLAVPALALPACKRTPRGHGGEAVGGGGTGGAPAARLRLLLKLDFTTPGMSFVTGLMPAAMHAEIDRCKLDFARDFGEVELEVANPRLFRIELSGAMTHDQVDCALTAILGEAGHVSISDRPGGGLRVVSAGMPVDSELRAALEKRLGEAPPGTQASGVFLAGRPDHRIESTVWLSLAGGELHVRYPDAAEVAPARAGLVSWLGKADAVSVEGRDLIVKETVFQLVDDAERAIVNSYDLQQERMRPTLEPGDISFIGMAPYLSLIERGDVVIFKCWDTPTAQCSGRLVGLPGDHVRLEGGVLPGAQAAGTYSYQPQGESPRQMHKWREHLGARSWTVVTGDGSSFPPLDVVVPPGSLYVLQDNRDATSDSRVHGPVARRDLIGLLAMTWWSMEAGKIRWDRVWKLVE